MTSRTLLGLATRIEKSWSEVCKTQRKELRGKRAAQPRTVRRSSELRPSPTSAGRQNEDAGTGAQAQKQSKGVSLVARNRVKTIIARLRNFRHDTTRPYRLRLAGCKHIKNRSHNRIKVEDRQKGRPKMR
ncbi:C6 transcription factor [Pseudozyma hubeiensis SY62]|uniref:C6 transcription factor n=1 Tax=Pseudozyma hubeiensis (strain SY62) TaxID=1305764 RepID=R9P3B7_PSEHS|nr:C6 transcription factor [Pseudozyma hubeiensis SY62]GAC92605.1 C6 transcription factor [Pseudozyma hubeiensis SY62]